jgi:hypothetical protein
VSPSRAIGPSPAIGRSTRDPRRAAATGQGFVEFGVILALAILVAVVVLVVFRPQLAWVLSMIGSEVDKAGWLISGAVPA